MNGIHTGHRQRLRERFRAQGLSGFAEHEALELLLTYAIPQKDVNPLAHALLERFGSLAAVLEADAGALMRCYRLPVLLAAVCGLVLASAVCGAIHRAGLLLFSPWQLLAALVMTALYGLCALAGVRSQLRRIVNKSIIENIRML